MSLFKTRLDNPQATCYNKIEVNHMNAFFTDSFRVSGIELCMRVQSEHSKLVHKNRPTHGLVIMLTGKTQYFFSDGSDMTVEEGELFYLPKFSNYRVKPILHGECIAVNFDLCDRSVTYPHFSLPAERKLKYTAMFRELLAAWNKRTPAQMNLCMCKLYELICAIQADAAAKYSDSSVKKTALRGAERIASSIEDPKLTVQEIAKELSVSPEYFRKLFASVYGISPKQYMIKLRIEKAKALILSGELPIREIGGLCGYEYECYFSREFKKEVGFSPTRFAEAAREEIKKT